MTFQPGELVVYGFSGVYRVEAQGPIGHIKGCDPQKTYYTLTSFHRRDTVYIPVDSPAYMRPLMDREAAQDLLDRAGSILGETCLSNNLSAIREHYHRILATHDCERLIGLIQAVNAKERQFAKAGKHVGKTDQDYKKKAESLVCEELSAALELPLEETQTLFKHALRRSDTPIRAIS
jgi:CarD family transcriptional regulator